jgi:aminomethyltransferase
VARVTHTGEPGYLIFGSPEIAPWLWERSVAAGAEPVGLEAWQAARVEAGIPWVGVDMDESTLISEVGLEEAITYGKGCYLGQEVVERVTSRGQVQRRRMGLVSLDPGVPQSGAVLESGEREVGVITSAAWSPALRAGIAMGYLRREVWEEGNEVIAVEAQGKRRLRVSRMPFYG